MKKVSKVRTDTRIQHLFILQFNKNAGSTRKMNTFVLNVQVFKLYFLLNVDFDAFTTLIISPLHWSGNRFVFNLVEARVRILSPSSREDSTLSKQQ
jgi:hypothetical protein